MSNSWWSVFFFPPPQIPNEFERWSTQGYKEISTITNRCRHKLGRLTFDQLWKPGFQFVMFSPFLNPLGFISLTCPSSTSGSSKHRRCHPAQLSFLNLPSAVRSWNVLEHVSIRDVRPTCWKTGPVVQSCDELTSSGHGPVVGPKGRVESQRPGAVPKSPRSWWANRSLSSPTSSDWLLFGRLMEAVRAPKAGTEKDSTKYSESWDLCQKVWWNRVKTPSNYTKKWCHLQYHPPVRPVSGNACPTRSTFPLRPISQAEARTKHKVTKSLHSPKYCYRL